MLKSINKHSINGKFTSKFYLCKMNNQYLFTALILLFCANVFAQRTEENIYNYDLVYMKNNTILKGEIIIFEEADGDITFKYLKEKPTPLHAMNTAILRKMSVIMKAIMTKFASFATAKSTTLKCLWVSCLLWLYLRIFRRYLTPKFAIVMNLMFAIKYFLWAFLLPLVNILTEITS